MRGPCSEVAPHHPLAHFLDQKAFALVVVEVKFLDRDGLGCCAVGGIDAPEASETLAKNGRAPRPQRGLRRVVLAPHEAESDAPAMGVNPLVRFRRYGCRAPLM